MISYIKVGHFIIIFYFHLRSIRRLFVDIIRDIYIQQLAILKKIMKSRLMGVSVIGVVCFKKKAQSSDISDN